MCQAFTDCLINEYNIAAYAPYSGTRFDVIENTIIEEAVPHALEKKPAAKPSTGVFARLLAAGQRLLVVIRRNEGGANKDLAKFADQINSLCDKWER